MTVTKETVAFINEAFKSREVSRMAKAIGTVAKTGNIAEVARQAKLARTSVYRAFAGGAPHPNLTTVVYVLEALGLELRVRPIRKRGAQSSNRIVTDPSRNRMRLD